jgi:ABC-type multidrug transport system ATPase subunit
LIDTQQLRRRLGTKASFVDVVGNSEKKRFVTLTWSDVCYTIPAKKKTPEKKILINVSGCVKPGQLLAIMGASGAGKTTMVRMRFYWRF